MLRGRRYVVPQDVFDVAPEVLRHRITLTYDALADGVRTDDVLREMLTPRPRPARRPSQIPQGDQVDTLVGRAAAGSTG